MIKESRSWMWGIYVAQIKKVRLVSIHYSFLPVFTTLPILLLLKYKYFK